MIWLEKLHLRGSYKSVIMVYIKEKYPHLLPLNQDIYVKGNKLYWQKLNMELQAFAEETGLDIDKNKISAEDYLETKGKDYRNTPFLQVYGHNDDECPVCKAALCKTVIGGRSSVYCPNCQGE
uniref:zinc finger domain-containing protein n=1 Tax=Candidatus Fimivicinus sp. TaxID=3056640 RepID=UPI003FF12689